MNSAVHGSELKVDRRGTALWVKLNRPEAFNAITPASVAHLGAVLDTIDADSSIRSLVITGAGAAFCAGADLKAVLAASNQGDPVQIVGRFLREVGNVFDRLEKLRVPTVAAINGVTLAGGLELALCCDIAVAADSATLGDGHAKFGQIPGGGGTVRLPRRIGAARAKYLMLCGQILSASKSQEWGLVHEVVPAGELEANVEKLTSKLEERSALVLTRIKSLVHDSQDSTLELALRAELSMSEWHLAAYDRNEGLAAFTEKRKAVYLGR